MPKDIPTISLAESEQAAFELFSQLAEGVRDVRGKYVEIDLGNYVHVLGEEERIKQIPWISATLGQPEQIIRLSHSGKRQTTNRHRELRQANPQHRRRRRQFLHCRR